MSKPLMRVERHGQICAMTPSELLQELAYANYAYNRRLSPEIPPAEWRKTIPEFTEAMEQRYQQERVQTDSRS